jgi:hypothetical protein
MKKTLLTIIAICATTPFGFSAISFDIQADKLQTSGGAAAPTTTLALLIADTGGTGFGSIQSGQSTGLNSVVGDSDDRVVGRFDLSANGTPGYLGVNPGGFTYAGVTNWAQGQALRLVWLPTLTTSSSSIASGTSYGAYTSATGIDGGSPWTTPAGGATGSTSNYKLYMFTSNGVIQTGSTASSAGLASLTVAGAVPEPSRVMLAAMGLGAFVLRRRRQA